MKLGMRVAAAMGAVLIIGVGSPSAAQEVPGGTISVDDTGRFLSNGQATISGTYSCEEGSGFAFITGNLTQPVGRLAPVRGDFITEAACTGATETWTATVQGAGAYRGGRAVASASLMVCDEVACVSVAETTENVHLRR